MTDDAALDGVAHAATRVSVKYRSRATDLRKSLKRFKKREKVK